MPVNIQEKRARAENYGGARSLVDIRYLVIHFTANNGDTAKNNADYFAREVIGASAHYFVDENEVWRSVPDDRVAWHCGTTGTYFHPYCRNKNSIGIELCSRKDANGVYYFAGETVERAAQLARQLREQYRITTILRHYDVTHKLCPEPCVRNVSAWQAFVKAVEREKEDDMVIYKTYEDCPDWAKDTVKKLVHLGYLHGDEQGILNLEHNMLRGLVINDRAGLYDGR
ncbi:MAG: N-acetylmuramoyl-L-alanine amidase [Butyricicoccus sp.]|nr:N-acetylmuramoyl-L-alanine amidase [Butyricicoccus sp.]